jgi:Xaa-Pro aminopeptidase
MTHDMTAEFRDRHRRVREAMEEEGLDAVIAYSNAKVRGCARYLSGYFVRAAGAQCLPDGRYHMFGSCAVLFPRDGEPVLLTDQPWDIERAQQLSIFGDTRYAANFGEEFGRLVADRGYRSVGIDNWFIFPAYCYLPLRELAPDASLVPTQLVERVYKVKSPYELDLIRRAEVAAVKAVEAGLAAVDVGVSEFEFALAAEIAMRQHGDLEIMANSIVLGGANTATGTGAPSHEPSYVMKSGDWALFDICPAYDGYAGDISRMIVAGDMADLDPELKRLYEVTLGLNEGAIEMVRPGVTPRELNEHAQAVAEDAGYGENKIGLLGHSLGIDMHDPPDFYWDDEPLEEGMCITIEPSLLIPGLGGTRVEDVVVVTSDGCEVPQRGVAERAARERVGLSRGAGRGH